MNTSQDHDRRSIRLEGYDYSLAGAYFVTICVQHQECQFGDIANEMMRLNDAGRMVEKWWAELPNKFPPVQLDKHVVMPNHFHGILIIVGAYLGGSAHTQVRPYRKSCNGSRP